MNDNLQETISKVFIDVVKALPNQIAYKYKDKKKQWHTATWQEAHQLMRQFAYALVDLKIKPGDKIGLIADNRFEWALTDFAIQFNGAVSVPRGTDSTKDELEYILEHSDSVAVIIENKKVYDKIKQFKKKPKATKQIIAFDPDGINDKKVLSFWDLVEKGKELEEKYTEEISKRLEAIQPDDVYTIIYTSGTTGLPKGVQGTHRNEVHQMRTIPPHVGVRFGKDSFLSILPVWHIFERMAEYVAIAAGATLIYTSIRDLKVDMREQQPTYMASAPRLWEQVYLGIYNNVQSGSAVKKTLFKMAYSLSHFKGKALRFLQGNELKLSPPNPFVSFLRGLYYVLLLPISYPFFKLLDTIVLSKIRAATGGQLRGSISGGGALPRHVDEFFNNIGVNVYEGYGMTESAPVIAARTPQKLVIGSVGPLLPEVEVEIRDFDNNPLPRGQKGVIWTKGPHVMKGYYKMPEQTAKTVVDDWLNTGDMGIISFNDTLSIVGRAKETIVLMGGENVEPVPIENKLLQSEYIGQVMVVGQDKKYLGALIYPDMEKLAQYMGVEDVNSLKIENLEKDKVIQDLYINELKGLVSADTGFKAFEKVTNFRFLPKAMEVDDELTNLGKMKRHVISDKYSDLIESMYQ